MLLLLCFPISSKTDFLSTVSCRGLLHKAHNVYFLIRYKKNMAKVIITESFRQVIHLKLTKTYAGLYTMTL